LGNATHVGLLAAASVANDQTGKAAADSLNRLSDDGVAKALTAVAKGRAEPAVRVNAIQSLINRREKDAVGALFDLAEDENAAVRQAAYKALGALSGQQELAKMVSTLLVAGSDPDRAAIERAINAVVTRLEEPDAAAIIAELDKASNEAKVHLLAVLPQFGGEKALQAVRGQLSSGEANVQNAAVRALADWPNPTPMSELLEIARTSDDSTRQILALRGYIRLLALPANRSAAKSVELLTGAMNAAKQADEKKTVLAALVRYPCKQALELAEASKTDSALSAEAELAIKRIKEAMLTKNLKARASRNSNYAHRAMDGDKASRWDTGRTMKPGDWFELDLGVESTLKGLTLDTTNSSNDYPRSFEVYISFDGGSWGKPIVTGKGTKPITEIKFPKPVQTRYVKIIQTGSSDSWHWSIHELTVEL
ncbi:MAG: discoidin domain-containing protein, partial [Planctomycetota bacterium]